MLTVSKWVISSKRLMTIAPYTDRQKLDMFSEIKISLTYEKNREYQYGRTFNGMSGDYIVAIEEGPLL